MHFSCKLLSLSTAALLTKAAAFLHVFSSLFYLTLFFCRIRISIVLKAAKQGCVGVCGCVFITSSNQVNALSKVQFCSLK